MLCVPTVYICVALTRQLGALVSVPGSELCSLRHSQGPLGDTLAFQDPSSSKTELPICLKSDLSVSEGDLLTPWKPFQA